MILFERQAQDQLPGGKYATPSPELLAQAVNVPATNMTSERDFGVFDLLLHLKPTARLIFLLYCGQTIRLHRGSILCPMKINKSAWLKQEQIPVT